MGNSTCLKLGGKAFDPKPKSPTAAKLLAFLASAPADEIYTLSLLADTTGIPFASIRSQRYLSEGELEIYSHRIGRARYFGSEKAIARLRKEVAQ